MGNERSRHDLGTTTLAAITKDTGGAVIESLKDIAPDLSEWIISFAYGDVMSSRALICVLDSSRQWQPLQQWAPQCLNFEFICTEHSM
jgi:hypothetical protein